MEDLAPPKTPPDDLVADSETALTRRDIPLLLGCGMLVLGLMMTSPWLIIALFGAGLIIVWWTIL